MVGRKWPTRLGSLYHLEKDREGRAHPNAKPWISHFLKRNPFSPDDIKSDPNHEALRIISQKDPELEPLRKKIARCSTLDEAHEMKY